MRSGLIKVELLELTVKS